MSVLFRDINYFINVELYMLCWVKFIKGKWWKI